MPEFRKKPVVIEAVQWNGNRIENPPAWLKDALDKEGAPNTTPGMIMRIGNHLHIGTLEGVTVADPMDRIIRGVKGELYACKPDIFEMTYERADAHEEEGRP